jgi:hypothetical protein
VQRVSLADGGLQATAASDDAEAEPEEDVDSDWDDPAPDEEREPAVEPSDPEPVPLAPPSVGVLAPSEWPPVEPSPKSTAVLPPQAATASRARSKELFIFVVLPSVPWSVRSSHGARSGRAST